MPKGVPLKGFRHTKRHDNISIEQIEASLIRRVPDLVEQLEKLTKPRVCSNCGHKDGQVDRDAIIYLLDRALGKPVQKQEVDVVQRIQLDADQIASVISKNLGGFLDYLAMNHPVELAQYVQERRLLTGGNHDETT